MPISKLGQRRQVVIPKEVGDELGLQEGDFVEVTSAEGEVIIKPKKLVKSEDVVIPGQKARTNVNIAMVMKTPKSLATLQKQAKKSGADKLTLKEIEAEIAAVRRRKTQPKV
jgi:AbrB family looped-hinge helix DNA binding protein